MSQEIQPERNERPFDHLKVMGKEEMGFGWKGTVGCRELPPRRKTHGARSAFIRAARGHMVGDDPTSSLSVNLPSDVEEVNGMVCIDRDEGSRGDG